MATSIVDGPFYVYGNMGPVPASVGSPVADPNQDAGPGITFMGDSMPDVRFTPFPKDKVQGYTGVVPTFLNLNYLQSVDQIPAAASATSIAAAQNVTNGTAMTLVATQAAGITPNVPFCPFSGSVNGAAVATAAVALDFGFAFGNLTSGSATIPVADSTQFEVGQPLVIMQSATSALFTLVASITDATHIVVGPNIPTATNATAPIGTGNLWGPSENGFPIPTAAMPYQAQGPGLFLDPAQSIARGIQITGATSGTGGTFTVAGWDIYGVPMHETITVGAGAVTGWGKKAFKYIASVTPNFTDAHNYSVGQSDVFGFHFRSLAWEYTNVFWAAAFMAATQGWTQADRTNPATATTGDVRGTVQTSANGGGTGIGASASNGTISGLAMSGRRLAIFQSLRLPDVIAGVPANPVSIFGQLQF